jgi:hypothetical protein
VVFGPGNRLENSTIKTATTGQVDSLITFPATAGELGAIEMAGNVFSNGKASPLRVTLSFPEGDIAGHLTGDRNAYNRIAFQTWYTSPVLTFAEWQAMIGGDQHSIVASSSADFDRTGIIDHADFLAWQTGVGLTATSGHWQGDADWDGDVDAVDLMMWSGSAESQPIPEPTALAMWMIVLAWKRLWA